MNPDQIAPWKQWKLAHMKDKQLETCIPEVSSIMRVLAGARFTDARLYTF